MRKSNYIRVKSETTTRLFQFYYSKSLSQTKDKLSMYNYQTLIYPNKISPTPSLAK